MNRLLLIALLIILTAGLFAQSSAEPPITRSRPASEVPVTNRDILTNYFKGGYLFPISYNWMNSSVEDMGSISGLSISLLRLGFSSIEYSETGKPFLVFQAGLMDNVGAGVLTIQDKQYEVVYSDLLSLYGGMTKPLANYAAYVNAGLKLSLFGQLPIADEVNTLNSDFVYVYDFIKEGNQYQTQRANDPALALELSLKGGLRVYQNWFASLNLGMRYNTAESGQWYLKSDVNDWENGNSIFEPDPWYLDDFPKNNSFFDGITPFVGISIGSNF